MHHTALLAPFPGSQWWNISSVHCSWDTSSCRSILRRPFPLLCHWDFKLLHHCVYQSSSRNLFPVSIVSLSKPWCLYFAWEPTLPESFRGDGGSRATKPGSWSWHRACGCLYHLLWGWDPHHGSPQFARHPQSHLLKNLNLKVAGEAARRQDGGFHLPSCPSSWETWLLHAPGCSAKSPSDREQAQGCAKQEHFEEVWITPVHCTLFPFRKQFNLNSLICSSLRIKKS